MKEINIMLMNNTSLKCYLEERECNKMMKKFKKYKGEGSLFINEFIVPKDKIVFIQLGAIQQ